jgi:sigma-B regulation protein RsbU (phosphoserine phosphatase)
VADVSGKGLSAAMLAATLQGAFVAVATGDPDPSDLFRRVNDFLCERTPPEMFATIFYGVLDQYGEFTFVNAGHAAPLVVRQGGVISRLDSSNFPLGLFSGATFEAEHVQLEYGEHVLMFSDGVTEAQNVEEELYGEARLKALLEECAGQSTQAICDRVMTAVRDFVGAAPQADDLTLTVLRFGPQSE